MLKWYIASVAALCLLGGYMTGSGCQASKDEKLIRGTQNETECVSRDNQCRDQISTLVTEDSEQKISRCPHPQHTLIAHRDNNRLDIRCACNGEKR